MFNQNFFKIVFINFLIVTTGISFFSKIALAGSKIREYRIKSDYPTFRDVSIEILKNYPNSLYIGIGRSPAPITAFLSAYGIQDVKTVPMTALRGAFGMVYLNPIEYSKEDNERMMQKKFGYLESIKRFLPLETVSNKEVILIDFMESGDALVVAKKLFQEYLEINRKVNKIYTVGMIKQPSSEEDDARVARIKRKGVDKIIYLPNGIAEKLYAKQYSQFSEYGYFSPTDHVLPSTESSSQYIFLREVLSKCIASDQTIVKSD